MIRLHRDFATTLMDGKTDAEGWMLEIQLFGILLQVALSR